MHSRCWRQSRFLTLIAAATMALASVASQAIASPRIWQPLVFKISSSMGTANIEDLEVLAIHGGKLEPIPFQIDQMSKDGDYVLPDGPKGSPIDSHRPLAPGDEIAMMFSDVGEKRDPKLELPPNTVEIEVDDPIDGAQHYVYIAAAKSPRLSSKHYASFDPATETIETEHYRIGLRNGLPIDYATQNRIGEHGPNLIDRMKVRLSTKILHMVPFSFNEDAIMSHALAWKIGPIRIIRRIAHSVNLIMGFGSAEVEREDLFYRDSLETPFKMPLPWAPKVFFGNIHVRIDLDFNDLRGYDLLWSDMKIPPIKLGDPAMERRVTEQGPIPVTWMGIRGADRMTLQTLKPSPDLLVLSRQLYFNDDGAKPDPPEHTPGEHPGIGYMITGWENLESGIRTFDALLITTPADYSPEVLMRELQTPVTGKTTRIPDSK